MPNIWVCHQHKRKQWLQFARRLAPMPPPTASEGPVTSPAALVAPPVNLPAPLTPFIGRASELLELAHLLTSPACRLLTLAGPGGVGKTRLAIEVAQTLHQQFAHGVYFVALAPLPTSEHIVLAMAEAISFCCADNNLRVAANPLLSRIR